MTLRLRNAMEWDLTLYVRIESGEGLALETRIDLPVGPVQTLAIPLQATTPAAWGMRAGPPMPWDEGGRRLLVATQVDGEIALDQVRAVRVYLRSPRSEERRVGKECRSRWWPAHQKKRRGGGREVRELSISD